MRVQASVSYTILSTFLVLTGCDGVIGATEEDEPWDEISTPVCEGDECVVNEEPMPPNPLNAVLDVGLRRLGHQELINTIRSRILLFRPEVYSAVEASLSALEEDPQFSVPYSAQELADAPFPYEAYAPSVFLAAYYMVYFRESNNALFSECGDDAEAPTADCLRQFFADHGRAFWRREVSAEEVEAFIEPYVSLPFSRQTRERFLSATMLSPYFVFRVEHGQPGSESEAIAPLSSYEIASRLSYFLWSDAPDDELLELAATGALLEDDELERQTLRLLQDPRSIRFFEALSRSWLHVNPEHLMFGSIRGREFSYVIDRYFQRPLQLDASCADAPEGERASCNYLRVEVDADERQFYNNLGPAMLDELAEFLRYVAVNESGTLGDLYLRDVVPARSAEAAWIYGVEPWDGSGEPPASPSPRGGVLGRAAFVASARTVTRPIIRGFHVWQGALCRDLADPPADVFFLPPPDVESYTTRELIAHSTDHPTCAGCHTRLNDFAFALESLDPVGRHRETEPFLGVDIRWDRVEQMQHADVLEASHMPVDVQANIRITPDERVAVDGPVGLAQAIVDYQAPDVTVLRPGADVGDAYRCLAKNLIEMGYNGAVVEDDTALSIEGAVRTGTVQDAILRIVQSPDFRQRVVEDPNAEEEL